MHQILMLYLLQFACLIIMLVNAFYVAVTRIHVRWINRRYECSRWMIFSSLLLMAIHFFLQMCYGFRASDEDVGAVVNILVICHASRSLQWPYTTSKPHTAIARR